MRLVACSSPPCSLAADAAARRSPTTPRPTARSRSRRRSTRWRSSPSGSAGDRRRRSTNLTQPGNEPHDLELTIKETAEVADADLVVYETASSRPSTTRSTQVAEGDVLDVGRRRGPRASTTRGRTARRQDPHFWQDPVRMADARRRGRRRAGRGRPRPRRRLRAPTPQTCAPTSSSSDATYDDGLADCERDTVVVSHDAFGYLDRYGLHFEAIAGLSPDAEPTPADLARLQELIDDDGHHHRVLRAAGQPAAGRDPGRRPGRHHRGARPDRGAERRDGRRGLPVPDARRTSRPCRRRTDAAAMSHRRPVRLTDGAVAIGGRPVLRGIDLTVESGRVRGADGRQRLGQVDAGPGADRAAAADRRARSSCSARRSTSSTTGAGSASSRSAPAPAPACPPRCGRSSPPAG